MQEQENAAQEQTVNPLAAAMWGDEVPSPTATVETATPAAATQAQETAQQTTTTTPATETEEVVDANEYLKNNLGYDNWDTAKKEIEELKKLKEAKAADEVKFANEESERLTKALLAGKEDEVYEILSKKKQLERVEKLDVSNPKDAEQLVRMNLRLKYADLDDNEIDDMLSEQYSRQPKPEKSLDMDDDEYEVRLSAWKAAEEAVNRKLVRDAKIVRPEVLSLQSKLVIPDNLVKGSQAQPEASQEDLAALQAAKESFTKSAAEALKSFNGFTASVKDKDVEIPVSYELSVDEKTKLQNYVTTFAENNLDANTIFADRWLNKDGTINAERMVKDLSLLLTEEKVTQKFANDAAAKRLEAYLKEKKNVDVSGSRSTGTFEPAGAAAEMERLREQVWG